jgi:hypothetical protein
VLLREARLSDAAVVVGPLPDRPEGLVRALETADVAVVLVDSRPFDPQWSPSRAVPSIDVTTDDRASVRVWADELGADAQVTDLASVIAPFRLGPEQIRRAVRAAHAFAAIEGEPFGAVHLQRGARQQVRRCSTSTPAASNPRSDGRTWCCPPNR